MIPNSYFEKFPIQTSFKSHGRWYGTDELGVIHQLDGQPYIYDQRYISTYDTEAYRRQSDILQGLRLGFVLGSHGRPVISLLDYGYGNGAFLKFCNPHIAGLYGYDVTGIHVEDCTTFNDWEVAGKFYGYDVITFWDALEHVPDLSFVADLPAKTVVISLPYCHYHTEGEPWFNDNYKHRKPDEHLHHFDEFSLPAFMWSMGWVKIAESTHEDIVRKSAHGLPNILTMAFKRK